MFHYKVATLVIMTVSLFCLQTEAQGPQFDRPLAIAASNNTSSNLASVVTSPVIGVLGDEPSVSSSASSGGSGVILPPTDQPKSKAGPGDGRKMRPFSTVAMVFKISTLGAGVELATPLSQRTNLRAVVNSIDFGQKFDYNGGNYNAEIHFHSAEMLVDLFPFHKGFHISPGIMVFNNKLAAQVKVPGGQTFEFEDDELNSSTTNPLWGGATAVYGKRIAPVLMMGFSNVLPRNGRHFSAPFEFGVAYPGVAQVTAHLYGSACTSQGCADVSTDAEAQSDVLKEQSDINSVVSKFQLYPIVSMGLAFRF